MQEDQCESSYLYPHGHKRDGSSENAKVLKSHFLTILYVDQSGFINKLYVGWIVVKMSVAQPLGKLNRPHDVRQGWVYTDQLDGWWIGQNLNSKKATK
jgi:hypothetical protein